MAKKRNNDEIIWDVTKEQSINDNKTYDCYFDADLSYELTGYIPINETSGLDFDPTPFIETGRKKLKTGKYCEAPIGSKAYKEFWTEQMERIKYGYKVGRYRVTGDHYFFLNFHPIMDVSNVEQAGMGRDFGLPSFWVEHYKYTHYIEMAEKLKRDISLLKSRGIGLSEISAACAERVYTAIPRSKQIFAAAAINYLVGDGVIGKVWNTLEFLNQQTEGGLRRLRQGKNAELHRKASVLNKQGEESGHLSEIIGQVVDNPRKLRGARIDRLYYEESGSFKDLATAWTQGNALVEINGHKFGLRVE